jgi:hypothetical protein
MVDLSPEDRNAIMRLWDHATPKLTKKEREEGNIRIDNQLHMKYAKKDVETTLALYTRNSRFEALDDTCGIAIGAFLDPARRHDNPMFDVQPITLEFLDRLELEHRKNSVWSM